MERLRKIRAERLELLNKAKALAATASKEERPLSEEESAVINDNKVKIQALDKEAETLEALVEMERTAPATVVVDTGGDGGTAANGRAHSITGGHERELDDPYRGFPAFDAGGFGMFLHSVIQAGRQNRIDPVVNGRVERRLAPLRSNAADLQAAAGSDDQHGESQVYGAFTVPMGFLARLLMLGMEDDPTAGTTPIPMAVPAIEIPARVDKNHSTSVSGGITVGWRPQTVALSSSLMSLESINLRAHTLGGISYVALELLADSAISFAALLEAGFRDAMTDAVVRSRIRGVGAGEPMGILSSPCLVSVDTSGQTSSTLTGANVVAMRKRCWRYSRAVWLANHDCYDQLVSAHVTHTNSDSPIFNPSRGTDVPDTLLGRPIIFTEYCSTVGTVGDILLCVWSEYLTGQLQGIQTAESMHVRFINNENTFRFTQRLAGEPWWRSALTPQNSTSTLSPFVALATRTA